MRKLYCLVFTLLLTINNYPQWVQTNGPFGDYITALTVNDAGLFAATNDGRVFLSNDNGISWISVSSGLPHDIIHCLESFGSSLFAGTNGGVYRSTNHGISWTEANSGLEISSVSSFAISYDSLIIFAGTGGNGVFRSVNNGLSWTKVNSGLTSTHINYLVTNGLNIFAGTGSSGVFRSTDNGINWTQANLGLTGLGDTLFLPVVSFFVKEAIIFVSQFGGTFLSTNNGESWTSADSGITNMAVNSFTSSATNIFAATFIIDNIGGRGVFLTTNSGLSWTEVNSGLMNKGVQCLLVNGNILFAGTWGGGLWERPLSEMIPVEMISFTATANGKELTLNWSTATELNNQGFEVQRKFGSSDFVTIGTVKGHGTTTAPNHYSFVDKLIDGGKYFYRLKQIDFNGTFEYSNEIEVDVRVLDKLTLEQNYPNPFNPTTTIEYVLQEKSNAKLILLNTLGEEITILVNEEQDKGYHKVELDGSKLASGVYFYQLKAGSFIETKKMILMR